MSVKPSGFHLGLRPSASHDSPSFCSRSEAMLDGSRGPAHSLRLRTRRPKIPVCTWISLQFGYNRLESKSRKVSVHCRWPLPRPQVPSLRLSLSCAHQRQHHRRVVFVQGRSILLGYAVSPIQGRRTPTFPVCFTYPSMGSPLQNLWWRVLSDKHAYRSIPHRHARHRSPQDLSPLAGAAALFQFGAWRNHFRESRRELGRLDKYPTMESVQMLRP